MSLEVYGFPHSPFCIAVETALQALGVEFSRRQVPAWDRSEILRLTQGAYYEVPVLVRDGEAVWESSDRSQDVARYVDRHFAGGRLFPERTEGIQDLVLHYLENEVEGVTFRLFDPTYVDSIGDVAHRGMVIRHKERKFGRGCVERWRSEQAGLLRETEQLLQPFERMLRRGTFLFGNQPVYADFLLEGILGNMTYEGHREIPPALPRLREFHQAIGVYRFAAS